MKTQKHQNFIKSFEINRQLITQTMKPTREKDEVSAAEGVLVHHGVKHAHSYLAQQCLTNVCTFINVRTMMIFYIINQITTCSTSLFNLSTFFLKMS